FLATIWWFEKKILSLHKIGCTSAIKSKLYCARFALSLHKNNMQTDKGETSFPYAHQHYFCKKNL
ncbi:MAG: hypothetical protein SPH22_08940, partial [Prevotella sp.]|nr:hypothetical protein [Prevotella sp.]MDY5289747.1 hypothetical protein [Prevotella sp.]